MLGTDLNQIMVPFCIKKSLQYNEEDQMIKDIYQKLFHFSLYIDRLSIQFVEAKSLDSQDQRDLIVFYLVFHYP